MIELQGDLLLAAMGGSSDTWFDDAVTGETSQVWQPYPFPTETSYKHFLDSLWSKVTPWLVRTQGQVLLMTHDGPKGMATATMHQHEEMWTELGGFKAGVFKSGSQSQLELL